jgi:hypothetical protein
MKTKLIAMVLLAGGSMFAQTRFAYTNRNECDVPASYQAAHRVENRYSEGYGQRENRGINVQRGSRFDQGRGGFQKDDNRGGYSNHGERR